MPRIPKIDVPIRSVTTEGPGRMTNGADGVAAGLQGFGETVSHVGQMFKNANDLAQKTRAENAYNKRVMDIHTRAEQDGNLSKENMDSYDTEISKAATDAAAMISSKDIKNQFGLEVQGQADISKNKIQGVFAKKIIEQGKTDLDQYMLDKENDYVQAGSPQEKQRAVLQRNQKLEDAVNAGFIHPGDKKRQIEELDKRWTKSQVEYDILTDPIGTRDRLRNKEYDNLSAVDRAGFIKKATEGVDYSQTQNNINNEADYLSKLASGQLNWLNKDDIGKDVAAGVISPKFGEALSKTIDKSDVEVSDENENYPAFIESIYRANNKEELHKALTSILEENKGISQEKLSVLINQAMKRSETLPLSTKFNNYGQGKTPQVTPEQQAIDSGALAITNFGRRSGMKNNQIADVYKNYSDAITAGKSPKEAYNGAIWTQAIKQNKALLTLPDEGQVMIDANGNKAKVYPDGRWEDVTQGSSSSPAPAKKGSTKSK